MLASTMKFSNNNPVPHTPHTPHKREQPCDRCSQETRNKRSHTTATHPPRKGRTTRPRHGPVVSGPNSVPNTTQQSIPACVPGHSQERIRTSCRPVPPGTYLLIFHP